VRDPPLAPRTRAAITTATRPRWCSARLSVRTARGVSCRRIRPSAEPLLGSERRTPSLRKTRRDCSVRDEAPASGDVWTREIDGVRNALRALAALGLQLAVVSNADGTVEQQLRDDGIGQVGPGDGVEFAAVIDSRIVGVHKPDPAIFRLALDAMGVAPEHTLHIGDTPAADVVGARAAGIHPVLVDPFDHHADLDCVRVRHLDDLVTLLGSMRGHA